MNYRFLPQEEWSKLQFIFDQFGGRLPEVGEILVAEQGDEIVGMLVLQLVAHSEPLWIKQGWRGKVSWQRMLAELDKLFLRGGAYFVFAPNGRITRMAELANMQKKDWTIWERTVQ